MSARSAIWTAAGAVTLVAVTVVGASVAQADDGTSGVSSTRPAAGSTASSAAGAQLGKACGRLPRRLQRVEKLQTRLHADATTRGSVAYLEARIATADAAGRTDVARVLQDRLAIRKDVEAQLPDILAKLTDAQQVCGGHGSSPASPAPSAPSS